MRDLIGREEAILAILNTESKVARETPYDSKVFGVMAKRQNEILDVLLTLPSAEPKTKCVAQIRIDRNDMEDLVNEKVNEMVDKMSEPKTGWIPVSERLPNDDGDYLVCMTWDSHKMDVLMWADGWNCVRLFNGEVDRSSEIDGTDILAWMPLSEPYREDGEA